MWESSKAPAWWGKLKSGVEKGAATVVNGSREGFIKAKAHTDDRLEEARKSETWQKVAKAATEAKGNIETQAKVIENKAGETLTKIQGAVNRALPDTVPCPKRVVIFQSTPLGMTLAALGGGHGGRHGGDAHDAHDAYDDADDDVDGERAAPPVQVDALVAVAEVTLFVLRDAVVLADVWEEVQGLGSAVTTRQQLRIALHRDGLGVAASPRCPVVGGPQRDALVLWPRRREAVLQGMPAAAYYLCAESTGALWPLLDLLLRRDREA